MKLTILVNDYGDRKDLINAHGFSVLIENKENHFLFDTGINGEIIENAKKLGKDLSKINDVIISHGHYDHIGGLKPLSKIVDGGINLYMSHNAFVQKYKKISDNKYKKIGMDNDIVTYNINFVPFMGNLIVGNKFFLTHIMKDTNYKEDYFFIDDDDNEGKLKPDYFLDEIVLVVIENDEAVIVTGCSHSGLKNILNTVTAIFEGIKIKLLIGGFHLSKVPNEIILKTAKDLNNFNIAKIGVYHCTGERAFKIFKQELTHTEVFFGKTGDVISV